MIEIKDWKKFQHFKDRRPPWIKLYRELLDDPDWHALAAEDAKILVMLWLVASENYGTLPDTRKLAFRLRLPLLVIDQTLARLSHWLILDDIMLASRRYQDDTPEGETETETETEGETDSVAIATAAIAAPCPPIFTDSKHELWGDGIPALVSLGIPETRARPMVGRWLRQTGDNADEVLGAIRRAVTTRVIDPIPWITRALGGQDATNRRRNNQTFASYAIERARLAAESSGT